MRVDAYVSVYKADLFLICALQSSRGKVFESDVSLGGGGGEGACTPVCFGIFRYLLRVRL